MSLIDRALEYATTCHEDTNHLYDGQPYMIHLKQTLRFANKYANYVDEKYQEIVWSACLCHDVIEDCRQSFTDVKEVLGEHAANIVYALTNEKGKTRSERANVKYYQGIRAVSYATFVKLCDRLANVSYSLEFGNMERLEMYRREHDLMKAQLSFGGYEKMWNELNEMLYR